MRKILENYRTIVIELLGIIGGLIWANNKQWKEEEPWILLIGSVIGFLFSIGFLIFKEKNSNQSNIGIRPEEISKKIKKAPLFLQDQTANNFIGLDVSWTLIISMIHKYESDKKVSVSLTPKKHAWLGVRFETNIEKFPMLKLAEDGDTFAVSGRIIKCDEFDIDLQLISLNKIK